jgi:hypothetical protein
MKKELYLLFLFAALSCRSIQTTKINSNFVSSKTELKVIAGKDQEYFIRSSSDSNNQDTLSVGFLNMGLGGFGLELNLSKTISPRIVLWSNDKKMTKDFELKSYKLTLNNSQFEVGDQMMGYIECVSKPIESNLKNKTVKIRGYFKHIIGKTIIVIDGKTYEVD